MTALALRVESGAVAANDNVAAGLPALVRRAADQLASATTAAEVLEARGEADFTYDTAKSAARMARARGAHDEVVAAALRAEADALYIKAMAEKRLAEEYEAAAKRGEVALPGGIVGSTFRDRKGELPTVKDLGLAYSTMSRFRDIKKLEEDEPGFIRNSLDRIIERGDEPTKAALGREINTRLNSFSGDNEWYTPARYVDMAREVMGTIDTDPASNPTAQRAVRAATYYTAETNGLDKEWHGKVWMNPPYSNPEVQQFAEKVIAEYQSGRVTEAIVLTNNSADTGWHRAMQDACTRMCTTTGRIRFESPTRQGNSPAMGQSFFYFGDDPERFKDIFSAIGNVWKLA